MIRLNLHQAAAITGATLVGKPVRFVGVTSDSRGACQGRLFVALGGERTDGERFCQAAIENGAVAVMVTRAQDVPVPQLLVTDTRKALSALAAAWHRQVSPLTIAVTGSNGKTTVKNMLASIMVQSRKTHATAGNYNNEIGVPLTLLEMPADCEVAVIEMGAAQPGDIAALSALAPPDVAVVTNVSEAHGGRFGSLDTIAAGKSELYRALKNEGIAIVNRDGAYFDFMTEAAGSARLLTFGRHEHSDIRLLDQHKPSHRCQLQLPTGHVLSVQLPLAGEHNALNAAAAVAAAWSVGVSAEDMQAGLERFTPAPGRLQHRGRVRGMEILDDSYNANPASVRAAIDVLAKSPKPAWLVLGDMAELGAASEELHRQVGEYAQQQGIDALWSVGPEAARAAQAMGGKGKAFDDKKTLLEALWSAWPERGTLLVKASRSMRMEDVVNELIKREKAA